MIPYVNVMKNFIQMEKIIQLSGIVFCIILFSFVAKAQDAADSVFYDQNTTEDELDTALVEDELFEETDVDTTVEEAERMERESEEEAARLKEEEKAAKESLKASKAELKAIKAEKRARKAERKAEKAKKKAEREKEKLNRSK